MTDSFLIPYYAFAAIGTIIAAIFVIGDWYEKKHGPLTPA